MKRKMRALQPCKKSPLLWTGQDSGNEANIMCGTQNTEHRIWSGRNLRSRRLRRLGLPAGTVQVHNLGAWGAGRQDARLLDVGVWTSLSSAKLGACPGKESAVCFCKAQIYLVYQKRKPGWRLKDVRNGQLCLAAAPVFTLGSTRILLGRPFQHNNNRTSNSRKAPRV
jgi:hypothetical protein